MRTAQLILFFFLFVGFSFSQDLNPINGVVKDASTGSPLPYTQISLAGTSLGTVTNEDGFFRLKMADGGYPDAGDPDSLLVSFLGYQTEILPVSSFDTGPLEIFLIPVSLNLREVEIIALSPREVLRRAFDSIPVNFGSDTIILTAFIRTQKMVNKKLAEYTEAIVEDMKDGYYPYKPGETDRKHRVSNIPYLYKGRVTSDTNLVNLLGEVGASARCLGCNFVRDIAEFPYETILDDRDRKYYDLKMEELINPDGGKIYRIRFDQNEKTTKTLYQGEILIDSRDFAIMQITYKPSYKAFDAYEKKKFNRTWFLNNQPGWIQEMPLGETTVTYAKRGDFWSLNTIRQQYWVTYIQPQTRQRIGYGYKNEVVVTNITRDPVLIREFQGDKSIGVNQRWDEVVGETDEAFWENFNYLPIEEKLREELDRLDRLDR
ncbi:MAG: carboxypeptidase-like regulatory domain-containing protein [Bacteroidales bacterium]|nr:carboxypeptidase-like regulatory domain-containing protein [Bacteroidales bacterium]